MNTAQRKLMSESPKYGAGDIIVVITGYKTLPGIKDLKPGTYEILDFRPAAFSQIQYGMSYVFKSTRKNSSYRYSYSQQWLEENSHLKQQ
jgi:hypothetical protein